jgi:RHS repeat-associated protein
MRKRYWQTDLNAGYAPARSAGNMRTVNRGDGFMRQCVRGQAAFLGCGVVLLLSALPARGDIHPNQQRGFAAETFAVGDLDSVNLLNGNLIVNIPLGVVYPVSPTLSYQFRLVYNSNVWEHISIGCGGAEYTQSIPNPNSNVGLGWSLSFGHLWRADDKWLNAGGVLAGYGLGVYMYVGQDGAQHVFFEKMRAADPEDPEDMSGGSPKPNILDHSTFYSRDGSLLRLRVVERLQSGQRYEIDFPNGQIHRFERYETTSGKPLGGRLIQMRDRFDNSVDFAYDALGWTVTDSTLRRHRVNTRAAGGKFPWPGGVLPEGSSPRGELPERITSVERLNAAGQAEATYRLDYNEDVGLVSDVLREKNGVYACGTSEPNVWPTLPDSDKFPQLMAVSATDSEPYIMLYGGLNGRLSDLTLPLRGRLKWSYGTYALPSESCLISGGPVGPNGNREGACPSAKQARSLSIGVGRRTLETPAGPTGNWVYFRSTHFAPASINPNALVEARRSVLQVESGLLTTNYFSISTGGPQFWAPPHLRLEFGLPYSRSEKWADISDDNLGEDVFRSTKTYECTPGVDPAGGGMPAHNQEASVSACTLRRSTWLRYEQDDVGLSETSAEAGMYESLISQSNRRLVAQRTAFHDDQAEKGNARKPRFTDVKYSDWDGYGHLEKVDYLDNFLAVTERSETTDWDVNAGARASWLLSRFTRREQKEGTSREVQEYSFDAGTNFLRCERRWAQPAARGKTDTVVTYLPNDKGQVAEEKWHGGDDSAFAVSTDSPCATGASRYGLKHEYRFGVRNLTQPILSVADGADASLAELKLLDLTIDQETGLVLSARDSGGLQTTFTYDAQGRPRTVNPPGDATITNTYFLSESPPRVTLLVGLASAPLAKEQWRFDGFGRVIGHELPRPNAANPTTANPAMDSVATVFNGVGWKTFVSERGMSSRGTRFERFDGFGRPGEIALADGSKTTISYRGNLRVQRASAVWNGTLNEAVTHVETYDGKGRLWTVEEADGTKTRYHYDVADRVIWVEHNVGGGNKNFRDFKYDGRGFLVKEIHPENGTTRYKYDARGNLIRTEREDGSNLRYSYDAAGRLREVSSPQAILKKFSYGSSGVAKGRLASAEAYNWRAIGAPTACSNLSVRQDYAYTPAHGRVLEMTTTLFQDAAERERWKQTYVYDAAGRTAQVGYPTCQTAACSSTPLTVETVYSYGRTTAINLPQVIASDISYHPNGLVSSLTHGSGVNKVIYTQGYDPNGMPRPFTVKVAKTDGTELWRQETYSYDPAGNIRWIGTPDPLPDSEPDGPPGLARNYAYDKNSRLVSTTIAGALLPTLADGSPSPTKFQQYKYDRFGNRIEITQGTVDPAGNQIVAPSGIVQYSVTEKNQLTGAAYTKTGSLKNYQGTVYEWDRFENLKSVTNGSESWTHTYDANNERIWSFRTWPSRIDTYALRSADGKVLREFTRLPTAPTWAWKDYVHREGQLLASVDNAGSVKHFDLDHLGTVRLTTDANGVATKHDYWPFGEEYTSAADGEQMKFTGHERDLGVLGDSADDMDYMHARYYRPGLARFLSVDPKLNRRAAAKNPQRWNRYSYTAGNPLKYVDPNGEDLMIVYDFSKSGLSQREQLQMMVGVRETFVKAGVENVHSYAAEGRQPTASKSTDVIQKVIVTSESLALLGGREAFGITNTILNHDSAVSTKSAPQGEQAKINFLVNVGAHEVGHGTGALPQYNFDGAGGPQGEKGTVMQQESDAEALGTQRVEFSPEDAEALRKKLNDPPPP